MGWSFGQGDQVSLGEEFLARFQFSTNSSRILWVISVDNFVFELVKDPGLPWYLLIIRLSNCDLN